MILGKIDQELRSKVFSRKVPKYWILKKKKNYNNNNKMKLLGKCTK